MNLSRRVADIKARGFVHLGSHLLLRNKTVSFALLGPLAHLVESSFSEADVFVSPKS